MRTERVGEPRQHKGRLIQEVRHHFDTDQGEADRTEFQVLQESQQGTHFAVMATRKTFDEAIQFIEDALSKGF